MLRGEYTFNTIPELYADTCNLYFIPFLIFSS